MLLPEKNGKLLKPEEHLFNICAEEGLNKTKDVLYTYYPDIAIKRGGTIMKNLTEFSEYQIQKESFKIKNENIFSIKDFDKLSNKTLSENQLLDFNEKYK
uniref:ORF99 n=1 Tax=Phytophthora infestans TaxID=4787 RepID=Q52VC6_PHYIN|nr:ORF99 [Phytophthora infestans]ADK36694.1 unknown [Phytophthora infestans]ADZ32020.1 ORF99 [Phytophthora infestans]ADZ32028.1 ORF99 [Phytophthora infestans]ADZ32036.1 ORF99 [Phytophthora infestans]